jgi:nitrogen fixation NifU-like protein
MSKEEGRPPMVVSSKLLRHVGDPTDIAPVAAPNAIGTATGHCGDFMEVSLRVEGETIAEIGARPQGCLYTMACASALVELAKGQTLEQALNLEPGDLERELGGLPNDHLHCARLAVNTLGEAIADFYRRQQASRPAVQTPARF